MSASKLQAKPSALSLTSVLGASRTRLKQKAVCLSAEESYDHMESICPEMFRARCGSRTTSTFASKLQRWISTDMTGLLKQALQSPFELEIHWHMLDHCCV